MLAYANDRKEPYGLANITVYTFASHFGTRRSDFQLLTSHNPEEHLLVYVVYQWRVQPLTVPIPPAMQPTVSVS